MSKMEVKDIYRKILEEGRYSKPRDEEVLELDYFQTEIGNPWSTYPVRKYNLDYFKREFQWYLGADPKDTRICEYASMWKKLVQEDGSIFSNYGFYWFGPQKGFDWVVSTLKEDPDSRQAYIPMNNYLHAFKGNKDFVCTKGIQFRIAKGRLNMHVAMRSSDAVFGLGTDLPCFYFLWIMVARKLDVGLGKFIFSADSVHIYERHMDMTVEIVEGNYMHLPSIHYIPRLTDVEDLIEGRFESPFGQWLMEAPL